MAKFSPGDTVVFDPSTLSGFDDWSLADKLDWYGDFGYEFLGAGEGFGVSPRKRLTYICEHKPQWGHCVLMQMWSGKLIPMCHTDNFRLATEDEV